MGCGFYEGCGSAEDVITTSGKNLGFIRKKLQLFTVIPIPSLAGISPAVSRRGIQTLGMEMGNAAPSPLELIYCQCPVHSHTWTHLPANEQEQNLQA